MRLARLAVYLWPGLPDLWWRGSIAGLMVALVFAAALNLAVAASWVWDSLLGPNRTGSLWIGLAVTWIGLLAVSLRGAIRADLLSRQQDTFPTAMAEYLRGNWLEAEVAARQLLADRPDDVEAALLLVTVLRRTRRTDEARSALDELSRWDGAGGWQMEIDGEYSRLVEIEEAGGAERDVHGMDATEESLPKMDRAA